MRSRKRSDKFFRHVLGTDKSDLVYEEKDELFDIGVSRSRDKAVILLGAFSKTSTDFRFIPANDPNATWKIIVARQADHEYDVDHRGDLFYIRTNKGAKNFRVVTAPVSDPAEKNWKEFVAHRPAVKVEDINLFADYAVLSEWENGLEQIEIVDFKQNQRHRIAFPEPVYSTGLSSNREFNTYDPALQLSIADHAEFGFRLRHELARRRACSNRRKCRADSTKTITKQNASLRPRLTVQRFPMSVVYRKTVKLDGSAPALLYGYGSYGISIPPTFSARPSGVTRSRRGLCHWTHSGWRRSWASPGAMPAA